MVYALWDTRSTNMVAAFETEREALELVLSEIERNGPRDTDTLVLEVEDERGELLYSLQGQELADVARKKLRPARLAGE